MSSILGTRADHGRLMETRRNIVREGWGWVGGGWWGVERGAGGVVKTQSQGTREVNELHIPNSSTFINLRRHIISCSLHATHRELRKDDGDHLGTFTGLHKLSPH